METISTKKEGGFSLKKTVDISIEGEFEQTFKREREYLVTNELLTVCKDVKRVIDQIVLNLIPTFESSQRKKKPISQSQTFGPNDTGSNVIPFDSSDGNIRGNCKIEGWTVTDIDVLLKSSKWNKSISPIKAVIVNPNNLKLIQLENLYHFVKLAQQQITDLENLIISPLVNSNFHDITPIHDSLELIIRTVQQAINELDPKSKAKESFPYRPLANSYSIYQPELPPEVVLDFAVCQSVIRVTCYFLHIVTSTGKTIPDYIPNPTVGQITKYKLGPTQKYFGEILEISMVDLPFPKLANTTELVHYCFKSLSELRDKLLMFT